MKVNVFEGGHVVDQINISDIKKSDFGVKEMNFTSKNNHSINLERIGQVYKATFYFNGKLHCTKSTNSLASMKEYIRSEIKK